MDMSCNLYLNQGLIIIQKNADFFSFIIIKKKKKLLQGSLTIAAKHSIRFHISVVSKNT